jgi:hypothetical protein
VLSRILGARAFWDAYKNYVWLAVPAITVVLALPALILLQSEIDSCRIQHDNVRATTAEFNHCLAATRAGNYATRLLMTGPIAAFAYIIVFFTARGEAAGRRLTLTFGGLADAYFVMLAFISSMTGFVLTLLFLTLVDLAWLNQRPFGL